MEQNELKRHRKLALQLNADITETTAVIAESTDDHMKALTANSLADMRQAWLILDERLRKT
jgi:hypothetical protein